MGITVIKVGVDIGGSDAVVIIVATVVAVMVGLIVFLRPKSPTKSISKRVSQ